MMCFPSMTPIVLEKFYLVVNFLVTSGHSSFVVGWEPGVTEALNEIKVKHVCFFTLF